MDKILLVDDESAITLLRSGPAWPISSWSPHVWEELYRGKGARGIPGSGLGLALVHAITLRHGGRASLRSRKGQGTVFSVQLPIE